MSGKLWFLGGLAAGYVLGTRAGREKFDQLAQTVRKVKDDPVVQDAIGIVQAEASKLYADGRNTLNEKLSHSKLGEKLAERRAELDTPANGMPAVNAKP
ncbi:hypothetical protein F4553_007167 [Allocatelliglobosispora scoriae]|uniref:YtxH domain-containing protein n=1 Tax=Allocatelliglobosispora scoriae TaxID=643052 RepID=A0A841C3M1_9ACTN|nr:hypothetical protein [Allocatelliglobosispora scoriae]MBB5873733.1 hypothetical protein [Allocatelliglobosispora scoriae]